MMVIGVTRPTKFGRSMRLGSGAMGEGEGSDEHMKHIADRKWHLRPWWMFWRPKWRRWKEATYRSYVGGQKYDSGGWEYQTTKCRAYDALREAAHVE
jgi:hypothetical protein